jgi:methylase of polypeptide subunit release factors
MGYMKFMLLVLMGGLIAACDLAKNQGSSQPIQDGPLQPLMAMLDTDGDGLISKSEYARTSRELASFEKSDTDASGALDIAELMGLVWWLNPTAGLESEARAGLTGQNAWSVWKKHALQLGEGWQTQVRPPPVALNPEASVKCGQGGRTLPPVSAVIPRVVERVTIPSLGEKIIRLESISFDIHSAKIWFSAMRTHVQLDHTDTVLDIGSGTGVLGLAALKQGAAKVVATELDPLAVQNTRLNASALGMGASVETRLVSHEDQGAFSVIRPDERFDLILADPPQGYDPIPRRTFPENDMIDGHAKEIYFSKDPAGCFLNSLLEGLSAHLSSDGMLLLALRPSRAKRLLPILSARYGLRYRSLLKPSDVLERAGVDKNDLAKDESDMSRNVVIYAVQQELGK